MKKIELNGLDETLFYEESLHNMPVYMWQNPKLNGFYLSLCVKYGSLHTDFNFKNKTYHMPLGIAHFMEHIKFNEKKGVKANDYFEKLGSDINAFTTFEYTNYEVFGNDNLEENLTHLIEYVLTPYFTKGIIANEKGIISEEIKMDKDNPYSNLFFNSLGNVFKRSHYRNRVAGDIKDIKNITLEDIKLIFEAFYHPENMFLVISGNINPYESMQIVNDTFVKLNIKKYSRPEIIKEKEPIKVFKTSDTYYDNVELPKVKYCLKMPKKRFKDFENVKLQAILDIILNTNFGSVTDFNEELLENNMILSFTYNAGFYDDYLLINFTFESKMPEAVIGKIKEQLDNLNVTEKDLTRSLNSSIANLVLKYDDIELVSNDIQSDLIMYGTIHDNIKEMYKKITLSDINKVIKCLDISNVSITKVLPFMK
ncbi:MAG: insulinase family protein [Bacilli bacterium]|nr:insulinase family protein [Bacilli bacterium]